MTTLMNRPTDTRTPKPRTAATDPAAEATVTAPSAPARRPGTYTARYDLPLGTPRAGGSYISTGRRALTRPRALGSYVDTATHLNRRAAASYTLRG